MPYIPVIAIFAFVLALIALGVIAYLCVVIDALIKAAKEGAEITLDLVKALDEHIRA